MKNKISLLVTLFITAGVLYLLSISVGPLPPAGPFFNPLQGFWANAEKWSVTGELELNADELTEPVNIYFDDRGVPHIFAQNDEDLYFAQGYVSARDRLFQMELQVRAAGGTLAEWLGEDLVNYDRSQRRLGMMYGAEKALEEIILDETVSSILNAYSAGVNAYIETLTYEKYPVEYKILDAEPEQWEPIKTALLLKYMTQMLAGRSDDVRMSNTIAHFGEDFADRFLSRRPDLMDPVVPPETIWDFTPKSTEKPDELYMPTFTEEIDHWKPDPLNGSNNWVVDGSKTDSGFPILSNDMHLGMTVPAIWYEIQLRTPDSNAYGVSLLGSPTIIVGFTDSIAWGSTNTGADVMDWYEITFRDDDKTYYLHDDIWLPTTERVETIRVKGGETVRDTILFTHHGPIYESSEETPASQIIQKNHALRWIAHEPSNELLTFYKLNRGKNYTDFKEAFRSYKAPAQNMNYAGTDGNIAIQSGGLFPLKWKFQGRTVGDGSDSRYDWNEFIPYDQNPYSLNPERGYLSAANQYPAGEDYPYYLGDAFAPFERGKRINDLLAEMENITVQDFKVMLMDNFSYHAYRALPVMLEQMDNKNLTESEREIIENLSEWNFENEGERIEPSIFFTWWSELNTAIWSNKYDTAYPMRRPSRDITVDLMINEPNSTWFNNIKTDQTETLSDLVRSSFKSALERMNNRYGEHGESWMWGYVNNTNLNHPGQIPGLGVQNLFTDGGAESINAIRGSHGPSWRMIVELDPEGVRAYGVYPGGQSGNPGSKTYDEFIDTWLEGEMYELLFLQSEPTVEQADDFPLIMRLR